MLGFIKDKAQQAKALVGEAVEASASAIVSSDSPSVLVLEGEKKGWKKITKRSKCFLLKKEPKQRKQKERTSEKMIVFEF